MSERVFTYMQFEKESIRPRYFFHLLKGSDPRYLVLNFSNILPINNWDMA